MSVPFYIQPGTYRLRRDIQNPTPDRRKSSNWTAGPIVKAGEIFVITPAGGDLPSTVGTMRCLHYSHYHKSSTHSELGQALIPELEPIPESTGALLLRLGVDSWHLPSFLAHLIDSGVMTAGELEHEFSNWLDKPDSNES